jgi:hypothetical protein
MSKKIIIRSNKHLLTYSMNKLFTRTGLFLILMCVALPKPAKAQGQVKRLLRGSNFQVSAGYHYHNIDLEALNSTIAAKGYPELSENIHSFSFLTQNISNRYVMTLKTSFSLKDEVSFQNREVEYKNQHYAVQIGYNLLSSDKAMLLPTIGGTLVKNNLLIQNKASTSNFQNLLQNPNQEANIQNLSYLADLGVAYNYMFYRRERENEIGKSSTWIPLTLKVGYLIELGSGDFKFDGDKVAGVPDVSAAGLYASLHIGLGTRLHPVK